jgi:hypothetical protein
MSNWWTSASTAATTTTAATLQGQAEHLLSFFYLWSIITTNIYINTYIHTYNIYIYIYCFSELRGHMPLSWLLIYRQSKQHDQNKDYFVENETEDYFSEVFKSCLALLLVRSTAWEGEVLVVDLLSAIVTGDCHTRVSGPIRQLKILVNQNVRKGSSI